MFTVSVLLGRQFFADTVASYLEFRFICDYLEKFQLYFTQKLSVQSSSSLILLFVPKITANIEAPAYASKVIIVQAHESDHLKIQNKPPPATSNHSAIASILSSVDHPAGKILREGRYVLRRVCRFLFLHSVISIVLDRTNVNKSEVTIDYSCLPEASRRALRNPG